jgi:phage tail sheath protein FI
MPVQVSYPGVYVQEIPSGVHTITGVSTSIAMFVGRTAEGELNKPKLLFNFSEYQRAFGTNTLVSEMTDAVRLFFLNGGQQCWAMRISDNAAKRATVTLKNTLKQNVLDVTAKGAGLSGGNIRLAIDYDTVEPENTFNLRVFRQIEVSTGVFNEEGVEFFGNVSMDPDSPRYALNLVTQQSNIITFSLASGAPSIIPPFSRSGRVDGDILTTLKALADPDPLTFEMSIDGVQFSAITLSPPDLESSDAIKGKIEADLGLATGDLAVSLPAIDDALEHLQISGAAAAVKAVRIRPGGGTNDLAVAFQLGVEQGGIEVGAFSSRRPAPSGLFFDLGDPAISPLLARLNDFATQQQGSITRFAISVGGVQTIVPIPRVRTTSATDKMYLGLQSTNPSLANVREKLHEIANAVNASTGANFPWIAAVHGIRLMLIPTTGEANFSGEVTSGNNTGPIGANGYDLGAGSNAFARDDVKVRYFRLGAGGKGTYQGNGTNGSDGGAPGPNDYKDGYDTIDREIDIFNLLILPKDRDQTEDTRRSLWGPASVFCQGRRAFLLIDPPLSWKHVTDIIDLNSVDSISKLRQGLVKDHAGVFWPQIVMVSNGSDRRIAPSGAIAGTMARIDSNRGVWKAPAGLEADIRGIRGVVQTMSDPENGVINPQAVNAIRVFPNGIVSWGARTMDGFDNSGNDDYKYIPVRRLALFLEESLYRGLKFAVFEPNDEPLWAQIRLAAGAFMNNLFRQGAFQGQKASDAYFVKVDSETTTQNDINLGIVNVVVAFAPLKPAEFVVITIQQKAGQVQT